MVVLKGNPVDIPCHASALINDTWSYAWYKDDIPVAEGNGISVLSSGGLAISRVRQNENRNDAGVYVCVATCQYGKMRSRPAKLQIACKYCIVLLPFVSDSYVVVWKRFAPIVTILFKFDC